MAYPIHKPIIFVTSHHGLWPVEKLNYAYGLPNESFTIGFFMALPCLEERFYLPFYFQQMQWRPYMHAQSSTLLHLPILCSLIPLMEGGTATRVIVPREWDNQNATSPEHSNQRKKRSISRPVIFYCKIVAPEKQPLTPILRFSNHQATKSGSTFLPRVCDVQPPCRSHAHLYERDNFHHTTGGSLTASLTKGGQVQSVSRGRGGEGGEMGEGEVNWTLKKD